MPIVCRSGLADRSLLAKGAAGTGPFTITEAVPDDHYTLAKNPDYDWGPDGASTSVTGFPDQVTIRIIPNETTAANLMLTGEVNAASIRGADQDRIRAQAALETTGQTVTGELWFNQKPGHATDDLAVRQALAMALDLGELAKVSTGGTGELLSALAVLDPRGCSYDSATGNVPEQDVEQAGQLLDRAGWTKGSDGVRSKDGQQLTLNLLYQSGEEDQAAAVELLAKTWKDELGVTAETQALADTAFVEAVFAGDDWDAAWLPLNASLPTTVTPFVSGPGPVDGGSNFAGIDNPTYTEFATQAVGNPGDAGCDLWKQAEAAIFTDVDLLPIAQSPSPVFGVGATFTARGDAVVPTSIRVLAG